ncbi:MAG: Omp28-related outer membrane protein, partial [Bacteroidia bacterium]
HLHKPVRTGISLSVSGTESQVNINVKAHFGVNYNDNLNLTVYLVEDNLVYDQTNYYNDDPSSVYYQAGAIMTGFIHRNTMIATATDMFGDHIPADSIDIDKVYELNFQVSSIHVTNFNNLKVVAFVSYASGAKKDQVINSLVCGFNQDSESSLIDN